MGRKTARIQPLIGHFKRHSRHPRIRRPRYKERNSQDSFRPALIRSYPHGDCTVTAIDTPDRCTTVSIDIFGDLRDRRFDTYPSLDVHNVLGAARALHIMPTGLSWEQSIAFAVDTLETVVFSLRYTHYEQLKLKLIAPQGTATWRGPESSRATHGIVQVQRLMLAMSKLLKCTRIALQLCVLQEGARDKMRGQERSMEACVCNEVVIDWSGNVVTIADMSRELEMLFAYWRRTKAQWKGSIGHQDPNEVST